MIILGSIYSTMAFYYCLIFLTVSFNDNDYMI